MESSGYRWLIDELVEVAASSVAASRIRKNGHAVRTNESNDLPLSAEEREEKELILSLEPSAREVVARLIEAARRSAIHDLLCLLDGEIAGERITLLVGGQKLAESPYASFHYDFICRLEGDSWPDIE